MTMSMPAVGDYVEAIAHGGCFEDQELSSSEPVPGGQWGLHLVLLSGNLATVFKLKDSSSKFWAVKCFTRNIGRLEERYRKLREHIQNLEQKGSNLHYSVRFEYLSRGIQVSSREDWYPVVKMDWVEGQTLDQFISDIVSNPPKSDCRDKLLQLAKLWYELALELERNEIAHGDLQHGNVLVIEKDGKLDVKLVDYDGVGLPSLSQVESEGEGHSAYSHRKRVYEREMDGFPILSIFLSLCALAVEGKNCGINIAKTMHFCSKNKTMRTLTGRKSFKNCSGRMTQWYGS